MKTNNSTAVEACKQLETSLVHVLHFWGTRHLAISDARLRALEKQHNLGTLKEIKASLAILRKFLGVPQNWQTMIAPDVPDYAKMTITIEDVKAKIAENGGRWSFRKNGYEAAIIKDVGRGDEQITYTGGAWPTLRLLTARERRDRPKRR